jgi:Domain of unknown function (DUF1877)
MKWYLHFAMEKNGVLCTLSDARLRQIEGTPELLSELCEARRDTDVPGLLDLADTWDALDYLLSDRGREPILGDAILARTGRAIAASTAHGKARVLLPDRVAQISAALARLPRDVVRIRFPSLLGKEIHGDYGQDRTPSEREVQTVARSLTRVSSIYARAATAGHGMLAVLV